jgi:hypothetical protein
MLTKPKEKEEITPSDSTKQFLEEGLRLAAEEEAMRIDSEMTIMNQESE